jgi:zinc transporter 1
MQRLPESVSPTRKVTLDNPLEPDFLSRQQNKILVDMDNERQIDQHAPESGSQNRIHGSGSMNMKALVLHVLGDALGNVGVIATGLVIWLTTWKYRYYFDPAISLIITLIIFSSALPLGKS